MNEMSNDPLPDELLPESSIDDGDSYHWEIRVQNLMSAARPLLAEYRTEPAPWWADLAERWRPRLAVAVGAAAALTVAVHFALPSPSAQLDSSTSVAPFSITI